MPLDEQRAVANVRERKRTQKLNQAYKQLQSIIPKEPSDKMSKIHTLKLALTYIDFLNNILKEEDGSECAGPIKLNLTGCKSGKHQEHQEQHQQQHSVVNSPNASSSSSSYATQLSAATSEMAEEEEYQHRSKRARFDSGQHGSNYAPVQQASVTSCHYATIRNEFQVEQANGCNAYQDYTANHHHHQLVDQNCADALYANTEHSPKTDDMTSYLRNAFREYRTGKRKSQS